MTALLKCSKPFKVCTIFTACALMLYVRILLSALIHLSFCNSCWLHFSANNSRVGRWVLLDCCFYCIVHVLLIAYCSCFLPSFWHQYSLALFHYSARNARIASAVLATAIPSVCLSVTRRYCVKTTARSTGAVCTVLDSKMCLVL